jgi:hypothetical protein
VDKDPNSSEEQRTAAKVNKDGAAEALDRAKDRETALQTEVVEEQKKVDALKNEVENALPKQVNDLDNQVTQVINNKTLNINTSLIWK